MWRLALGALAVLSVVAAPSALAGGPGKRSFTSTSSPDRHALPVPRRGLPRCQVLADAKGPGGVIGKIMLDLYAR